MPMPAAHAHSSSSYRPEIDGLRALAVLSVLAYHAFPNWIHGGFVGVDVFFVISGYLISGIIYRELDERRFSFAHFYSRRIKRIFPALIVVLIATFAAGQSLLIVDELTRLNENIIASAASVSNLYLLTQAGYFEGASNTNPLLHLWSLGIEEQFYILWPILLVLCWKRSRAVWLLAGLMALSFVLNLAMVEALPTQTFYLPFTRFWELWAGAFLAFLEFRRAQKPSESAAFVSTAPGRLRQSMRALRPYAGLVLIVGSIFLFSSSDAFPGWRAVLPVAGTVLLLGGRRDNAVNRLLLANPVSMFFGRISYPLYLWHWPILAYLSLQFEHTEVPHRFRLTALLASVVLAWLTYRLVERPIRFGASTALKPALLSVAMVLVAAVAVGQWRYELGRHDAETEYVQFFSSYSKTHALQKRYAFQCGFIDSRGKPRETIDAQCTTSATSQAVFIWGDSHAQALRYGAAQEIPAGTALLQVATFGCHPALVPSRQQGDACNRSNAYALDAIKRIRPAIVVLAQQSRHEATDWTAIAERLRADGVQRVVLVGPCPEWTPNLYRVMVKDFAPPRPARLKTHLIDEVMQTDRVLRDRYGASPVLTYASVIDALCNEEGCITYLDGNDREGLTTFDFGHLTLVGSTYVGRHVLTPAFGTVLRPGTR